MGFLLGGVLGSLTNPIWLVLGAITGFLLGRRHFNLGWSSVVIVYVGSTAFYYLRPNLILGLGLYAYPIIVGVAFLLTRLFSESTEADGS